LKYINKIVVIFLPAVLLLTGAFGQNVDKIIAKVDNQILLRSELELAYLQYVAQEQNIENKNLADVKCKVLETLLINKLMLAKAEIDSVTVDKEAIDEQMDRRMQYFINQAGGNAKKLEEYYNKSIDELKKELRKGVKEQMVIQKMQETITAKVKITPADVRKFFSAIPQDSLPFFSTEVEVGQIVRVPDVGKDQKNSAKVKLEKIKDRIMKGEDFCKLAEMYSEDPGSAKNCGELGWFKRGELVPQYEAAALKLKPGEFSPIIESQFGFHLIQLIERRASEYNSRHILIKPNSSVKDIGATEHFLDSLRNLVLADSISFEKAANQYSIDRDTKNNGGFFLDPNTGSTKIPYEEIDPVIFFIIDTMKAGSITPPLPYRMTDGSEGMRIIYYKSKTPPHKANLIDDYQKIYKAALEERKNVILNEWFDKNKNDVFVDVDPEYKECNITLSQ